MTSKKKIALFGATGNMGGKLLGQALERGYTIKALVRNPAKLNSSSPEVEVLLGNATDLSDVERAIEGGDIVISCLGNVNQVHIMYTAHNNILKAAAQRAHPPKCLFVSSIGCGGTSWLVKQMLCLIGGREGFNDYERADKRIREETKVPFVLVRPYALTDKPYTGRYYASQKPKATFFKPISRSDVAAFMLDAIDQNQWLGEKGVQLGGAKS